MSLYFCFVCSYYLALAEVQIITVLLETVSENIKNTAWLRPVVAVGAAGCFSWVFFVCFYINQSFLVDSASDSCSSC